MIRPPAVISSCCGADPKAAAVSDQSPRVNHAPSVLVGRLFVCAKCWINVYPQHRKANPPHWHGEGHVPVPFHRSEQVGQGMVGCVLRPWRLQGLLLVLGVRRGGFVLLAMDIGVSH